MAKSILGDINKNKSFGIECFGVRLSLKAGRSEMLDSLKSLIGTTFPVEWREVSARTAGHAFEIVEDKAGFALYKNEQLVIKSDSCEKCLNALESNLRLTVAEFAPELVFLHAGVVGWNGEAVIIPGKSFSGKTTLVAEFVRRGCDYLSDEYAIIDREGLIYPFPKKLSVRGIIDDFTQTELDVEHFGGKRAPKPLPAGSLVLTEYRRDMVENKIPRTAAGSVGAGILACIANSISIRRQPQAVLEILNKVVARCRILQSERGEASEFVEHFLKFLSGGASEK